MTIRFDDEQAEALRVYAATHGISMQTTVITAVERFIHDDTRRELVHRTASQLAQQYAEALQRLADS